MLKPKETKTKHACPLASLRPRRSGPVRRGSALIFATIILFSLLAITVTLSAITVSDMKMSQKTKSTTGAFFNADSGVEWALNKIANSDSSAFINTLPGITFNTDGSAQCPFGGCNVFFLKSDGTVINSAQLTTLTIDDIKAVRSVGTQGAETQRAIEAAVAAGTACKSEYMGMTPGAYNGSAAGPKIAGINEKCNAAFPGSRLCLCEEVFALDGPYGLSDLLIDSNGVAWCGGNPPSVGNSQCHFWTSSNSVNYGGVANRPDPSDPGFSLYYNYRDCSKVRRIHCCKVSCP